MARQQTPPPGWFPDHQDPSLVRFWNGREWTSQTAPAHPPAPIAQPQYGATPPGPWKRLRRRTKVLLVVAALVVAGWLVPDDKTDAEPVADRSDSSQRSQSGDDVSSDEEPSPEESSEPQDREPVEEVAEDELVEEEPIEEVVEEISVPALAATPIKDARKVLRRAGLVVHVVQQPSWDPVGTVLRQGTKAGTALTVGEVVRLVVAAPMPRVPAVLGTGADAARKALGSAGFKVALVTKEVPSGTSNMVLGQTPAPTDQAAPGSVVRLVVSKVVAPPPPPPPANDCTAGYRPCLAPAYDYDCAGGSGDGPGYAYGPIYITGTDPYGLDNDGDGVACES